ncbi:MAG: CHASE2 domain-containing protein [Rhodospirillales bacterium]
MAPQALKPGAPKAAGLRNPAEAPAGLRGRLPGLGDFAWRDLVALLAAAAVIAGVSVTAVRGLVFLKIAEQWLIDFRLTALKPGQAEPHPSIVIATITEETLATLEYRSPVDRAFLARVVNQLREKGAAVVGLDFLFDQPTVKEKDDALRQALNDWPVPPVVAWAGFDEGLTKKQVETMETFFQGVRVRRGFATLDADEDGTVRAIFSGRADDVTKKWEPSFPGALAAQIGVEPPRQPLGLSYLTRDPLKQPVFESYEAHLIGDLPGPLFKGKTVLIGVDLPDADRYRTPLAAVLGHGAGSMPGVAVHAQALSQLLDGRQLPRVNGAVEIALTLLAAILAIGLILVETRAWVKAAASAALLAAFVILVSAPLLANGPLLPLLAPVLAFLVSLTVGAVYVARRYRDKKRFIRDAFARYVEPKVVQRLLENPAALVTEGESREMTLLFTDMENFTALAETIQPRVLVKVMGQYFDGICEIVIKSGGTIDKFIGDAVVAIFGAPAALPDHAQRAVEAAVAIHRFAEEYRQRAKNEFDVKLGSTRVGVHTGAAIVGNFGSSQRHNYTAMGDTVNTASRLEGANKHLGTTICVSDATAKRCKKIEFLPLGTLRLKGKAGRIDAYTPIEREQSAQPWFRAYMDGFRLLREGKEEAIEAFARVGGGNPAASVAARHAERVQKGSRDLLIALEEK